MMRSQVNHLNPLNFNLRQRIIFNRLPMNEKLFIRLREGRNNNEKLKSSIKFEIASVAQYYLNQITTHNDTIDVQILSENNVYFYPALLKPLLNIIIDSNPVDLEVIRTSLYLVTQLYILSKNNFDALPNDNTRFRMEALVKSTAILSHHANHTIKIIDLYRDIDHKQRRLLTHFQLLIEQVQYHDITSNIEALSPEIYCSITDDSRKRINLYDLGQLEETNMFDCVQKTASCLYSFFSSSISSIVNGYHYLTAEKSNAEKINAYENLNIPEEYLCQIKQEIMTNPVYDKHHIQYKFERSNILKALSTQKPYTRTPLNETELIDDLELKNKISSFIHSLSDVTETTKLIENTP